MTREGSLDEACAKSRFGCREGFAAHRSAHDGLTVGMSTITDVDATKAGTDAPGI